MSITRKFLTALIDLIFNVNRIVLSTSEDKKTAYVQGYERIGLKSLIGPGEAIIVDTSNNVGIGIAEPLEKLHVGGNARIEGDLIVYGGTTTLFTETKLTEQVLVSNDGTATSLVVNQSGDKDIAQFQSNGNTILRIDNQGYIGINNEDPELPLDINGVIRTTGFMVKNKLLINENGELDLDSLNIDKDGTIGGSLFVTKNININNDNFIVDADGNVTTQGKLDLMQDLNINDGVFIVDTDGNIISSGNLNLLQSLHINDSFSIDNSGNITSLGDLDLSNNLRINETAFTVDNQGNISAIGELHLGNSLYLNDVFNVDTLGNIISLGDVDIAGTIRINNDQIIGDSEGNLYLNNSININSAFEVDNIGNIKAIGDIDISNNLRINDSAFTVDNLGNVTAIGDLHIGNNMRINNDQFIVDNIGNIIANGELHLANNFILNEDKFVVDNVGNVGINGDTFLLGILNINNYTQIDNEGNVLISNNLNVNNGFIVDNAGNSYVANDLEVFNNFKVNTDQFTIDNVGNITSMGDLDLSNNLRINKNAFIVDNAGNISATGDLDISNNLRINENAFIVDNLGNITSMGDFDLSNNLRINENAFIVDNAGNISAMGDLDLSNNLRINENAFIVDNVGNISAIGDFDLSNNLRINENAFVVDNLGNVSILGNVEITKDVYINTDKFTVDSITGNTTIAGTLDISNNLAINDVFMIDSISGDTKIKGSLDISHNFSINENKFIITDTGKTDISDNLTVANVFYADTSTNKVGINNNNPKYELDISGNANLHQLIVDKIGNRGYIINNLNSHLCTKLSNNNIIYNDNIFTLTQYGVPFHKSVIEYDLSKYLDNNFPDILHFNFEVTFIKNSILGGEGLWISFYNGISYKSTDNYNPNVNLNGYSLYIDVYNNNGSISLFSGSNLLETFTSNTKELVNTSETYHTICLLLQKNTDSFNIQLLINNTPYIDTTIEEIPINFKYLAIGALNRAGSVSLTQKVKNITLYVENYLPNRELQIYGNSLLRGNIQTDGDINMNGSLYNKSSIISNKIATFGNIINMPGIFDPSFKFNVFTTDNTSYSYDTESMLIRLVSETSPSSKSVIEFNTNISLKEIEFKFDILVTKMNNISTCGFGFWISILNSSSYENNIIDYTTSLGGLSIYIDIYNKLIKLCENGIEVSSKNVDDQFILYQNYNNIIVKSIQDNNNIFIQLFINNKQYFSYLSFLQISNNNLFCIGGINGTLGLTSTQTIKNISLSGYYNEFDKSLQIIGDSLLNGNVDINGPLNISGNTFLDGSLLIGTNSIYVDPSLNRIGICTNNPQETLHVNGNVRLDGDLTITGTYTTINTETKVTDQLIINNDGTGPGLIVNQSGNNDILEIKDDNISIFKIIDGGYVGINTTTPSARLHVNGDTNITGSLDISNNFSILNTFIVESNTGDTYINGKLNVHDEMLLDNNLNINNVFTVDSSTGNTYINGTLLLNNKFTIDSTTGNTFIKGKLDLSNNLAVNDVFSVDTLGNVDISGNTNIDGILNINNNLIVKDNVNIEGNLDISNNLTIFGNVEMIQDVKIYGALELKNNISFGGNTQVDGSGNMNIDGTLNVNKGIEVNTYLDVSGNTYISGSLDISKNFNVNNNSFNIDPSGNTYIKGNLDISNNLTISGNTYINGSLDLINDFNLNNKFKVNSLSGYTEIYGDLDISKNLSINGNLIIDLSGNTYIKDTDISGNLKVANNALFISKNNNYVGINTDQPASHLHINGNAIIEGDLTINGTMTTINTDTQITDQLVINNSGTGPAIIANQSGANDIIDFQDDGISVFRIKDGGNIGINTITPSEKLDISGGYIKSNGYKLNGFNTPILDTSGNMTIPSTFKTTDTLYVNPNNVGIKNQNPNYTLDVNGDINYTGDIRRNGEILIDTMPVGTILPYAGNNVPQDWLKCDGREISRSTYADLFSVIGTSYGNGDGTITFNIPDLRGRDIIGSGQGTNLTNRTIGEIGGAEKHVLKVSEMPSHSHRIYNTTSNTQGEYSVNGAYDILTGDIGGAYQSETADGLNFIESVGESQPHNNMQPYTVCNYIIKTIPLASLLHKPFNFWIKDISNSLHYMDGSIALGKETPNMNYTLDVSGNINVDGSIYIRNTKVVDENTLLNIVNKIYNTNTATKIDINFNIGNSESTRSSKSYNYRTQYSITSESILKSDKLLSNTFECSLSNDKLVSLIAIGDNCLFYSRDGNNWSRCNNININASDIAYNGNMWLSVGSEIAKSYDGITWTIISNQNMKCVLWDGEQWIICDNLGKLYKSKTGLLWKYITDTGIANITKLAYNGSQYIITDGNNGRIAISYNLIEWTNVTVNLTTVNTILWNGIIWYIAGLFLNNTSLLFSQDGINWNPINNSANIISEVSSLAWNGNKWIAVGDTIAISNDGLNWTANNNFISNTKDGFDLVNNTNAFTNNNTVIWSGQQFIIGGAILATSINGLSWNKCKVQVPSNINKIFIRSNGSHRVIFPGNQVIVGGEGNINNLATTFDNSKWINLYRPIETRIHTILYNDGVWIAGGEGTQYNMAYSTNGKDWYGTCKYPLNNACYCIYYDKTEHLWYAGGSGSFHNIVYSYDGITWIGDGRILDGKCYGVNKFKNLWIITGEDSSMNTIYISNDRNTWTPKNNIINIGYCIASNDNIVIVGGSGDNSIAISKDGNTWTSLTVSIDKCYTIAWNGEYWLAGGVKDNLSRLLRSDDSITWTILTSTIITYEIRSLVWCGDNWIMGGRGNTNNLAYSLDGHEWYSYDEDPMTINQSYSVKTVCWNNCDTGYLRLQQMTIAVGQGDLDTLAYSYDGIKWFGCGKSLFSIKGNSVHWNGIMWLALGQGTNSMGYSYDGKKWIPIPAIFNMGIYAAWNGSKWIAVGQGTNTMAFSLNGIDWTPITSSPFSTKGSCVIWTGKQWYATGDNNILASSLDGIIWTNITSPFDQKINNIFITSTYLILIGKSNNGDSIAMYDYFNESWNKYNSLGEGKSIMIDNRNNILIGGIGINKLIRYNNSIQTITTSLYNINSICWNNRFFLIGGEGSNTIEISEDTNTILPITNPLNICCNYISSNSKIGTVYIPDGIAIDNILTLYTPEYITTNSLLISLKQDNLF